MGGGFRVRERAVLHFNVADFAVAVERVEDCRLRQRPLLIAPLQAARAVVYDMSEEAYREGVRKGMPLRQATRICRGAAVLPPRAGLYHKAMLAFYNATVALGVADKVTSFTMSDFSRTLKPNSAGTDATSL